MARRSPEFCSGPLPRREWLRLGGLALGALGAGPALSETLLAETAGDSDFSVILFWANGGPSHLETFDLKPDAPAEIRGPFRPIATNLAGIDIGEIFPQLARRADKFTLLRSLYHERAEHSGGTHRFLSGYPSVAANLQDAEFPEIGSIVARMLDAGAGAVPTFVGNTKVYGGGPAYLGPAFAPFMPSPNPITSTGANTYDPVPIYPVPGQPDNLAVDGDGVVTLARRGDVLQSLDRLSRQLDRSGAMQSVDTFQRRALEMLASRKAREAFDVDREPAAVRERYGDHHWGRSLLTCRRLVEAGVRFVQCQANFRLRPETGRTTTWDDHSVNCDIFGAYRERGPSLDQSMSALIDDLFSRGLERRVLFLFCGEFGRTPIIRNQDASGRPGRDHWPRAMSVLLSGGGLRMGQVIGATNRKGEEPVDRAMNSNCLLATLYRRFGIDPTHAFPNHAGRPIPILPLGTPIRELL